MWNSRYITWYGFLNWFYAKSSIVGYFVKNPAYTYILNMYGL